MGSLGRQLHVHAAKAREEGKFTESLDYNDKALFAYEAANDVLGFAEGIACRSITLRVYANAHDSRKLLILAKYELLGAVVIARESGDKKTLAMPLYNLAQVQEDLGELSDAVCTYKEAVTYMIKYPAEIHNRASILANMQVHMTICEYKSGNTSALVYAERALLALEAADEPTKYNKDVWVSGAYMRFADALRKDNLVKAKEYLQKAKDIIDANPALILRHQQLKKIISSIPF